MASCAHAAQAGDHGGSGGVGPVVAAAQAQAVDGEETLLAIAPAQDDPAFAQEGAVAGDVAAQAEVEHLAAGYAGQGAGHGVVVAQDGVVIGRLAAEDVGLEAPVLVPGEAVQVVGGDVQDAGHVRAAVRQ